MTETLYIRDGAQRARVLQRIMELPLDKPWEVTIKPYRSNRSIEQNNFYWRILTIIGDETGNTKDAMHEFVRGKFLPTEFVKVGPESREVRPSTAKLKVDEMAKLIDQIIAWAQTDLGIVLPADERGMR